MRVRRFGACGRLTPVVFSETLSLTKSLNTRARGTPLHERKPGRTGPLIFASTGRDRVCRPPAARRTGDLMIEAPRREESMKLAFKSALGAAALGIAAALAGAPSQ